LALISEGHKRAGAGLLWAYEAENESIEEMSEIEIAVDHRNEPALITRFTQAPVVPYGEVSWAAYARDGTQRSRQL
ncbi:MAG TPA: hypothetical protein VG324_03445, partial [Blastocatellia bacterium]|nr:hypothetical protein [Blastocatellia bacterium]